MSNRMGKLIQRQRMRRDLSLSDLAKIVGATKSHLWCIEQGRTINIGILLSVKLCNALQIGVAELAWLASEDAK